MRTRVLLASLLAIGCGPSEKTNKIPDAEEFPDSPIFVFPDAAPRADARVFDAKMAVPDAKAGTPDAPPPIDAPPPVDAKPQPVDAMAPMPDAMPTTGIRPWNGDTTSVRLFDFQLIGNTFATKVCLFDSDNDPRPYKVLSAVSHDTSPSSYVEGPSYVFVPAGIELFIQTLDADGPNPGTDPADCDRSMATDLANLKKADSYTLARTFVDDSFSDCDTGGICDFFPKWDVNRPQATCAPSRTYLIDDGNAGVAAGWRVINLMDNADVVAYTTVAGDFTGVLHLSIDSSSGDAVYNAPEAATTAITICPKYLEECLVPDPLTFSVADDDLTACSNGNATWRMGKLTTNRISSTIDSTTYYIIGQAPKLTQDTNGLETSGTVIVEAHDLF